MLTDHDTVTEKAGHDMTPDLNNNTPIAGHISVFKDLEGQCKVQKKLDIETAHELASLTNEIQWSVKVWEI